MYCVRAAMSLSRAARGGKHLRNARQGLLLSRANPAGNLSVGLARMDSTAPVIATAPLDLSAPADAAAAAVSSAVEPTFHSLGLAHAYPSGMLQSVMEAIHVHAGVPWWGTIVISEKKTYSIPSNYFNNSIFLIQPLPHFASSSSPWSFVLRRT